MLDIKELRSQNSDLSDLAADRIEHLEVAYASLFKYYQDALDLLNQSANTTQEPVAISDALAIKASADYVGWYCAHCNRAVDASEVTYHEQCTECGRVITNDVPPRASAQPTNSDVWDDMHLAYMTGYHKGKAEALASAQPINNDEVRDGVSVSDCHHRWVPISVRRPYIDGETHYLGINTAGYAATFNHLTGVQCPSGRVHWHGDYMTAEEQIIALSDIEYWMPIAIGPRESDLASAHGASA